jgi:16S rRNA (guanine527-N7)-methyltransferase
MTTEKIQALLASFVGPASLSSEQLAQVSAYLDMLLKWNSKINLTAVREPEEIVTRHFGESFFAARHLFPTRDFSMTAIDVGSGPGFPGVPLKIWNPALSLTLIEANQKKAVFLREVIRSLQLGCVDVLNQRAEAVGAKADLVSLRAVEQFEDTVLIASRLLEDNGTLALLIGAAQVERAQRLLPGLRWDSPISIPLSRNRVLLIGRT